MYKTKEKPENITARICDTISHSKHEQASETSRAECRQLPEHGETEGERTHAKKTKICNKIKNPRLNIPVKHIIAIASGKGGVGKSTVAANLAIELAATGKSVGILDADIYGPSQPLMMGDEHYKPQLNEEEKLIPAQAHGVSLMSIGFMVDPGKALIWRGPMAQNAFYQMIRDVDWTAHTDGKDLDVLIIDLPPGTGDIQLSMIQKINLAGAIIISTPQDIALIDARRAAQMFETMNVPVLGLIENMSTYICPKCGHEEHIFGKDGVRLEAETLGVEYLGDIPLSLDIREASDAGNPIALSKKAKSADKIKAIASKVIAALT